MKCLEIEGSKLGLLENDKLLRIRSLILLCKDQPAEFQSPSLLQSNNNSVNSNSNSGGVVVVGPQCAPTYSLVNAIIEQEEDGPRPRCGHTLITVLAVGEKGSPRYTGPRLILFGGATVLEGNFKASGTPSTAGSAGISMSWLHKLLMSTHPAKSAL
ncbi:Serine/threonine-protein phosphatase BSL3 [Abeliophyllum distichum]|uniref:Serine/threonine-protein phosphatase BSL3 n=1 Tax=Abeliophyllum distichum TaxID=126358 RepID=A0ABD1TDC3_9LAMI